MKAKLRFSVLIAICSCLFTVSSLAVSGASAPGEGDTENILKAYGKLPLYFIENKGQLDSKVRFYVKTSGQTLYFTGEGIVFELLRREKEAGKRSEGVEKGSEAKEAKTEQLVFNLRFEDARRGVLIEGLDRQEAGINYFVGNNRSKWKTSIPTYKGVVYKGIYKGIDLKVFGKGKDIEYEFIVNPGANPDDILLTYNGIEGLAKNGEGELLIATAFGKLKETRPYIYQEIEGKRAVDGSFEIRNSAGQSQTRKFSYGFQVAPYDPSYPLIIDPTLVYSTYLGDDCANGIAVDNSGNAYITGYTTSNDFPTQNPYQGIYAGGYYDIEEDVFITKLSASGSALVYSTYLGGTRDDCAYGIAVDSSGNAYVTGHTESSDFPTQNPYQGSFAGGYYWGCGDVFITKLSASGSALVYSTYLGGTSDDCANGIAVDSSGNAYVTGHTYSGDFPTQNPYQGTYGGGDWADAFITKLSASGSALVYSTYLGGTGTDFANGIAVDSSGNAYVTGGTYSGDFPTQNPYQGTFASLYGEDVFITKLSASGSVLVYSTYLGGFDGDQAHGIAVDSSGNAYVTGGTRSGDFPMQNPYQGTKAGPTDVFITKLSASGSALVYSTFLGGTRDDCAYGIAVDSSGNAYVTGGTRSGDFPMQNPYQGIYAGVYHDAFITKLSSSGRTLTYSTFLGGNGWDNGKGIAIDVSGNAYVTGYTTSSNFPTKSPYQGTISGDYYDVFITKLNDTTIAPTSTTQAVTSINTITATGNGNITNLGDPDPTQHGVCWNTTGTPTTSDRKTEEGAATATGAFTSNMTGLSPNTTYYVRAYATNSGGTGYGNDVSFKTSHTGGETTFQWPVYPYTLTITSITLQYADDSSGKYHAGIDIVSTMENSDTVKAVANGKVRRLDMGAIDYNNHEMGNVVIIDHNYGTNRVGSFCSLYAHLARIDVYDGEIVEKGDPIGIIGDTGCRDLTPPCGKHLHLEVKSWPVLANISDEGAQPPVYWGYTPEKPNWHGYINPYPYFEYSINDISPTPIRVTTNNAPVRTGPDPSYEKLFATVNSGQKFVAISEYGGWYLVYIPSNNGPTTGWVQGTVESSGIILEVNDPARGLDGVRVSDIPSTSSSEIVSHVWDNQLLLAKSQSPSGGGCSKQWYEVYLPDGLSSLTGWVCGENLSSSVLFVNKNDETCGGNSPCYTTIQEAINDASTGASIKIAQATYTELITLNESKSLTVQGGWDSAFTNQAPNKTIITQAPKVPKGSLTLQMITIKMWSSGTYTNSQGQTFVLLPAGTFTMGSPSDEPGRCSDETQHQVTLTQPFYMQTTEVTQEQWEGLMGSNPSSFSGCPTCPVEMVSWDDAQAYVAEMNKLGEGTYSLPTEAQWEYAARAGSTTAFANGEITEYSNMWDCEYDPNLDAIGWYCYNSGGRTHAVGQKSPNAWGLYDMSGNVWEWCQDWLGSYPSSAVTDPTGPSSGSYRVKRGGYWNFDAGSCRSATRPPSHDPIGYALHVYIGFRLLRQP